MASKGNPKTSIAKSVGGAAPKGGGHTVSESPMNGIRGGSHNYVKASTFEPRSAKGAKSGGMKGGKC